MKVLHDIFFHPQYKCVLGASTQTVLKINATLSFFTEIGVHSMQGWTAITRHRVTRKKSTKRLEQTKNLFKKNLQLKGVLILDFKSFRS